VRRGWVAVVAVLVVLGLVVALGLAALVALRNDDDQTASPPSPAPVTSASSDDRAMPETDPALAAYYDQTLTWTPCDDGNDCAQMLVPLDYQKPGGRSIELSLLRVSAADPGARIGSLVVNPGGPGASGKQYAAAATTVFRDALTDHYDIVGFDPRGVGDSAAIDCLTDDQLDAYLAADPDPDTPAEIAEVERQATEFGTGCVRRSGALAGHVSTVESARDMDVLRGVLQEPALDYFGASYGTELGATYAQLFPANVGRFVLDGAVDLGLDTREADLQQAAGFETALRSYVANCVDSGDCFLGETVDEGINTIQDLLADIDADPLPAGDRELTVGNAFYGLITPLYSRDYWILLSGALKSAQAGDGTALMTLADAYASRGPGGYTDNSIEANLDINCLDDPLSVPVARIPREFPAFEKASPTFGRAFAYSLVSCHGFAPRAGEPAPHTHADGAAPILVIGTTRDPATPLKWAQAMARQLSSAILVTRDGDGHTGYNSDNDCVDTTVEDYLVSGTVPTADVDCPAE